MDILLEEQSRSIQQVQRIQSFDQERHSEKKIKTFRSNNGREFTSNEFKYLCRDSRIKRELTTPYNPQQNGVAKRNNRTIMEAARDMLHDQDLPMHLWA